MINDTAFLVTSFERSHCLVALLESIEQHYPDARVYIADDSQEGYRPNADKIAEREIVEEWIQLDYDVGLSVKRNVLVEATDEPYLLILEDDFVFEARTDIADLRQILDVGAADLVAGVCERHRRKSQLASHFDYSRPTLYLDRDLTQPHQVVEGLPYSRPDYVPNFFLARREVLEDNPWDERYKLAEHLPFFLDMHDAGEYEVAQTRGVVVHHQRKRPSRYRRHRQRGRDLLTKALRDRGFDRLVRR